MGHQFMNIERIRTALSESSAAEIARQPRRVVSAHYARAIVNSRAVTIGQGQIVEPVKDVSGEVWQLWLQGWEGAPNSVKFMSEHTESVLMSRHFNRLDLKEALDKVDINPRTLDLYRGNKITHAGLSDLIRFKLLSKYGGLWIDATIFMRFEPDYLSGLQPFLFRYYERAQPNFQWRKFFATNWLMQFHQTSIFTATVAESLEEMWLSQKGQVDYFDAFYVMQFAAAQETVHNNEFSLMPSNTPDACEISQKMLVKDEQLSAIEPFWMGEPIHKLSYKGFTSEKNYLARLEALNYFCSP